MGKRQLLFVTHFDENLDDVVSYIIELAKTMHEDITLFLVQKKGNLVEKLGNLITAVSFAGIDEHDTARQTVAGGPQAGRQSREKKLSSLVEKCRKEGIQLKVHTTDMDAVMGIRTFLKEHTGIDKVVLSPVLTEAGNVTLKDLNRLVRTVSRPIVTMTRQASATA